MDTHEMTATGLSIWLTSDTFEGNTLCSVIETLAAPTRSAPFKWHLTVVGGVPTEALSVVNTFAYGLSHTFTTHPVWVDEVGFVVEDPQKALFLLIEEDQWLKVVRAVTELRFPDVHLPPYWHGSLQYGLLSPDDRERGFGFADRLLDHYMRLMHVEVWQTEGPVSAWSCLKRYNLRGAK